MFLNIFEIIDIIVLTAVMGYLFMEPKIHAAGKDVLDRYLSNSKKYFDWNSFWFAASVSAPSVILHEFGHKLVGLSYGLTSVFHAACSSSFVGTGYFLNFACILTLVAIVLKAIGFGFIFFVPAFVQTMGATSSQSIWIAIAGPLVNLTLFFIAWIILKNMKLKNNAVRYWTLTKHINIFLFAFNMIPIFGSDGSKILNAILAL
ncbi:MAG TPA: hypothetical protein VEC16_06765 [Alphaproteobacteria bacterium]|nr:hypothetical protein [Alphaproteobacteria bacterium]